MDKTTLELSFLDDFRKGILYTIQLSSLKDLSGNELSNKSMKFGIVEKPIVGDLLINEIMVENPSNSVEYIEFYNNSDKLLDLTGVIFTTRKSDKSLNKGNFIPAGTWMLPKGYLAVCENIDSLRNYFSSTTDANFCQTSWSTLNNDSSDLVLLNSTSDTIFDELRYSSKWHHVYIKNPKGVALERINPKLPTNDSKSWHSASSEVNYGTPGLQNSQYRDIDTTQVDKFVWASPESFTPDNDGQDDVCFIRYKSNYKGFVANIIIFNSVGNKICQLAKGILLSADGYIIWDGKMDDGRNAFPGIYVLYFEAFNPETGENKQIKIPIVISAR
jgi:Lamin Tail Domain